MTALVAAPAFHGGSAQADDDPPDVPRHLDPGDTDPVPRGTPPDPYAPPGQAQPRGAEAPAGSQGQRTGGDDGASAADAADGADGEDGFYYYDHVISPPGQRPRRGEPPANHEVARGDTLWDLTALYLGDPFEWPELWSRNPHITNPHWIYPGDEVRIRDDEEGADETDALGVGAGSRGEGGEGEAREASSPITTAFKLRQTAFIDARDLEVSAEVAGAPTERNLLTAGDTLYLDDARGTGLAVGEEYAIYAETREVEHPRTGDVVGAYVKVLGDLEVLALRDGERAVARITSSVDVVERGARVGPLKRRFHQVEPRPATADVRGLIVDTMDFIELVAANHLVILDQGARAGVEVGNPFYVVRRGDGHLGWMGGRDAVGQDDERFPSRIVGEIRVVDVAEDTSLGWVTSAAVEVGVGDHVMMRGDQQ